MINLEKVLKNFGPNLRTARQKKGFSQNALSKRCAGSIGVNEVSRFERGESHPGLKKLADLVYSLDCKYTDLLSEELQK